MPSLSRDEFVHITRDHAGNTTVAIPVAERLLADQLTPVLAYRRMVSRDARTDPSFLLESVEGGQRQGRHSIMGARPGVEVRATGNHVTIVHHRAGGDIEQSQDEDPLMSLRRLGGQVRLLREPAERVGGALPSCVLGGWFGYAGYDTVRYAEPEKLDPKNAPHDDRGLADLQFGLYDGVVVFDHVDKIVHVVELGMVEPGADAGEVYDKTVARIENRIDEIQRHSKPLPAGRIDRPGAVEPMQSNLTRDQHRAMVNTAKEYIRAGDIFQVVLGQRFERASTADPFDVYRALRAVNPSPYMVYLQAKGCILVASSPEILCRVRRKGDALVVTNRPLAGTRKRGATPEEDKALEAELLGDEKERAEHIMLVDLGRNDVGKVAKPGTVSLDAVMEVERYSHVMHISSTVTARLRAELDCWDALRAALPVGTISGAPKVRAMQIIDELEPIRRGPYGGGMGYASLDGEMDIALALRTMVVPTELHDADRWTYHIQAAGGIVADSNPDDEFMETVNKAAALGRAIDVAESAFGEDVFVGR